MGSEMCIRDRLVAISVIYCADVQKRSINISRKSVASIQSRNSRAPLNDKALPDPHDTQFCTDVSSWGGIEWVGKTIAKCNTTFVKERKEKSETVNILHSSQF